MRLLSALLYCALSANVLAADPQQAPQKFSHEQFLASLHFQDGRISLPKGIATLDLPPSFRYLPPADAEKVLVQAWNNPPDAEASQPLGMIVPADVNLLGDEGWGVVVTYDKDGHVKDDDADSINYTDLLKEMQASTADDNKERKKHGYTPLTLLGWAEAPHYDKPQHKLYWAKRLRAEGDAVDSLNFNVRVLGRDGVLVLNAVASVGQIARVKTGMQTVTAFTEFTPGNRYGDFNGKTDKVAEYGLAALVAGGVAARLGLFGKLFVLLLVLKKAFLLAIAAGGSWLCTLFGRRKKSEPAPVELDK
jgi:uncharacterized membrane-anchored protein